MKLCSQLTALVRSARKISGPLSFVRCKHTTAKRDRECKGINGSGNQAGQRQQPYTALINLINPYYECKISEYPGYNFGPYNSLYSCDGAFTHYSGPDLFFGWKLVWFLMAKKILALGNMDCGTSNYIDRTKRPLRRSIRNILKKRFAHNPCCYHYRMFRQFYFCKVQK